MRFRGKSIRRRIGALVLVPLLSLVSVWAYATAITVGDARRQLAASSASDALRPVTLELLQAIQRERRQTLVYLGDTRRTGLEAIQQATDEAVTDVEYAESDVRDDLSGSAEEALGNLTTALDDLDRLRLQVHDSTISLTGALDAYNAIAAPGLRLAAALEPVADVSIDRYGRAIVGMAQAREYLSQEDAMMAGALSAGRITQSELRSLTERIVEREQAYDLYLPNLPLEDRQDYASMWDSGSGRLLRSTEQSLQAGDPRTVTAEQWKQATSDALEELHQLGVRAEEGYQEQVGPENSALVRRAVLVGGVGFLAVLLSVFVALRLGRRHLRELRTVAREAEDAAEVRLPGVMRRLEAGERVDVETEAPWLEYGQDDLGRVGQSLNTLQRAAVSAAVERSSTRRGISEVFVNLARRNQVLLHRQLNLVETVERGVQDSGQRTDLVRLGHLTSRMRRHADGLMVLSGAVPPRQWSRPEQLMDVVRAAADEVEECERIELRRLPTLAVAGGAVADLTHLVAELMENATIFSPPHTAVQVSGERVPHGFILEIHDRGLGMTAEALKETNQRLAEPTDFELTDTDRLGLFVVSRLAERHGVRVSLRDSPYGGTTAITLIPGELLSETDETEHDVLPGRQSPLPAELDLPVDGGPVELESSPLGPDPALPSGGGPLAAVEHAAPPDPEPPPRIPRRPHPPVLVSDHGRTVGQPPDSSPDTAPGGPVQHQRPAEGEGGTDTTSAGLPRRVRRAGRMPGNGPGTAGTGAEPEGATSAGGHPAAGATADLDAEAIRTRMAALQRGWRRGRQQTDVRQGETPPGPRP
ncbi:nitrate- and nitrite sensing domain-containing protein [Streptomyces sp. B6B3]|uniref:sensor histidine kinase n=1 Tax=Streptomyces sp. B6B3 TaxID=3153570 RepID=UPI00325CB049